MVLNNLIRIEIQDLDDNSPELVNSVKLLKSISRSITKELKPIGKGTTHVTLALICKDCDPEEAIVSHELKGKFILMRCRHLAIIKLPMFGIVK